MGCPSRAWRRESRFPTRSWGPCTRSRTRWEVYDLHHGQINSVLLPVVVGQNLEHAKSKFARIAVAMGPKTGGMNEDEAAGRAREKIEELIEELEMPTKFSQLGLDSGDVPLLAELAQKDLCMQTNPYCFSLDEIEAMYRDVW